MTKILNEKENWEKNRNNKWKERTKKLEWKWRGRTFWCEEWKELVIFGVGWKFVDKSWNLDGFWPRKWGRTREEEERFEIGMKAEWWKFRVFKEAYTTSLHEWHVTAFSWTLAFTWTLGWLLTVRKSCTRWSVHDFPPMRQNTIVARRIVQLYRSLVDSRL